MNQKLNQIFKKMPEISHSLKLEGRILAAIEKQQAKSLKTKLLFSRLGFAVSLLAGIYTGWVYGTAFLQSEFWSLARLMFSDAGIVLAHWNEFVFSLLETFPVLSVLAILVPIFTLFLSLAYYAQLAGHRKILNF